MNSNSQDRRQPIPKTQRIICVLWSSFLIAGVQTIAFFTVFDPDVIFYEYNISRLGAYSIGFFAFWFFSILPCILTLYFAKPCQPCDFIKNDQ